jgi:DNA-binding MarR family transcriptional regulator
VEASEAVDPMARERGDDLGTPTTSEMVEVLNRTMARIRAHFGAVTAQLGVTPAQAKVLRYLDQPSSLSDLSVGLDSDVSNTANVVKALEAHGLLTRQPHDGDRRVRTLTLTDRGVRVREQLLKRAYEHSPVFDRLSEADKRLLYDLLLLIAQEPLDGSPG